MWSCLSVTSITLYAVENTSPNSHSMAPGTGFPEHYKLMQPVCHFPVKYFTCAFSTTYRLIDKTSIVIFSIFRSQAKHLREKVALKISSKGNYSIFKLIITNCYVYFSLHETVFRKYAKNSVKLYADQSISTAGCIFLSSDRKWLCLHPLALHPFQRYH